MQVDHLVVGAADLEAGVAWVERRLGVRPAGGGRHEAMGTHNRLLGLGPAYLEVLAVDPLAPSPTRSRWFGLDAFGGEPRLLHWVARVDDIEEAAHRGIEPLGPVLAAARGNLRWRITVPADGHLPGDGVVPSLIQWDGPDAASRLPASGWSLVQLRGAHPDPPRIQAALQALGASLAVSRSPAAGLRATLRGPRGTALLD